MPKEDLVDDLKKEIKNSFYALKQNENLDPSDLKLIWNMNELTTLSARIPQGTEESNPVLVEGK